MDTESRDDRRIVIIEFYKDEVACDKLEFRITCLNTSFDNLTN